MFVSETRFIEGELVNLDTPQTITWNTRLNGVICFLGKASSFEEEDGTGVGRNEIRVQVGSFLYGSNLDILWFQVQF